MTLARKVDRLPLSHLDRGVSRAPRPKVFLRLAILGTASALLLKLGLAFWTAGTNDVVYWTAYAAYLRNFGALRVYSDIPGFNHPPFMLQVLRTLTFLSVSTGLSFAFWLRLPGILADVGSVFLLWKILDVPAATTSVKTAFLLFTVAPVSVMVSGFHGNTDAVMIFFLLLTVVALDRSGHSWLAGAALGASMSIKVWPVAFIPTMYAHLPDRRRRVQFLLGAGSVFGAGSLPYIFQAPFLIVRRVFGYGGIYGDWGWSRVLTWLQTVAPGHLTILNVVYFKFGVALVFFAIVLVSFRMDRLTPRPSLYAQCGIVAFAFMFLSPAFGVQYLAWLVPWVIGLGTGPTLLFYVPSGLFLYFAYHGWTRQRAQYSDLSDQVLAWHGFTIGLEVLCWISVGIVLALLLRQAHAGRQGTPA